MESTSSSSSVLQAASNSVPVSGLQNTSTAQGRAPSPYHGSDSSPVPMSLGETILRDYASHIDPLNTNGETHVIHKPKIVPTLTVDQDSNPLDRPNPPTQPTEKRAKAAASLAPLRVPPPFPYRTHRKSADSSEIPQQTIMKALASRSGPSGSLATPLANALNNLKVTAKDSGNKDQGSPSSSITATMASMHQNASSAFTPSPEWLLKSPCYFHQQLERVVDMQKALPDISDEDFTHSRLMQTATAVRETAKHLQKRPLKQAVRTVMIVTKARDNRLVHVTRELAEWLLSTPRYGSDIGVNVYVDAKLRQSKRFDAAGLIRKDPRFQHMLKYWTPDICWYSPEKFDLVLTLGGDGTVLFTSWLFQRVVPPILSFSMGSLGFLTNFAFHEYQKILSHAMGDAGMRINLRMRFTCTVWRSEAAASSTHLGAAVEGEQFEVLNELVIDRGPSPYVSNLELWENDHLLTIIQADGCIFSTPTGSTAYSLSAGGALVSPEIPAVLLTPICPHTLSFRPMLLSDTVALRICVPARSRASVYCSFDGRGRVELKRGDYVTLEASQYPFPTVMSGPNEWLESVQRKLQWNTREVVQQAWEDGTDSMDDKKLDGTDADVAVLTDEESSRWDIDTDSTAYDAILDSGLGQSEDGAFEQQQQQQQQQQQPPPPHFTSIFPNAMTRNPGTASPLRRGPTLLDL